MSGPCSPHVRGVRTEFSWENMKESNHYVDLDVEWSIILKWIVQK
jgi:hypothetical protein